MSIQTKIDELNRRITLLTNSDRSTRGNVRIRLVGIKDSLSSLIQRVRSLNNNAGEAREELERMRLASDALRNQITTITGEKDALQTQLDANDIKGIGEEIDSSIVKMDELLKTMEDDDTITKSLKALEDEIELLETSVKDKEDGQAGGRKRRRTRRNKKARSRKSKKSKKSRRC
jgi:hypothetical protein|uniref:Uncharacterized protein n=1 Tax=viral metagenome TaxID=1070528 RepID=A0A6C0LY97_9ZZZZ